MRVPSVVLIGATGIVLLAACPSFAPWRQADRFIADLECEMTVAEVKSVVSSYPPLEVRRLSGSPPWDYVATRGDTMIEFDFRDEHLVRVRVSWIDAPMHRVYRPAHSMCEAAEAKQTGEEIG